MTEDIAGSWPHSPWLTAYSYVLTPLDGGFYWKLFCQGERVNGGIGNDFADAVDSARLAAQQHIHSAMTVRPYLT